MEALTPKYYILNNNLCAISSVGDIEKKYTGEKLYEVIRIINGKPLFIEDHLLRFKNSLRVRSKGELFNPGETLVQLNALIEANNIREGNIKFQYVLNAVEKPTFLAYQIPHKYPTEADYKNGVKLSIYQAERKEPSVKAEQTELRNITQTIIDTGNVTEVLLVNSKGFITEGSKSSFLLIKNDTIFSAPFAEILEGITFKNIINLCQKLNINIIEKHVNPNSLNDFDAAFISGTSPKILPISAVDNYLFDVNNPLLRKIMLNFDQTIENYLQTH